MTTQSAPSVSSPPQRHHRQFNRRRQFNGFLFVLPAIVFTLIFFIFPLIMTGWMSLNDWPLLGTPKFSGLENYAALVEDKYFLRSLWFTIKYTLLVVPPVIILGLLLALLVNQPLTGVGLLRTSYFIPVVVGFAASSYIWVWLFHNEAGIINTVLRDLGLLKGDIVWMADKNLALGGVVFSVVWKTAGFAMILFLAGIQAIPGELHEAARVDGANAWSRFIHITLPLLRRTFALVLILTMIGAFLSFDQFFVMTSGGPRRQTFTAVYLIFAESFQAFNMGYGAAISMVLLVILLFFSYLQLRLLRDNTRY